MNTRSMSRRSRKVKLEPFEQNQEITEPSAQTSTDENCYVCRSRILDKSKLDACDHVGCFLCLREWLWITMSCGVCRAKPKEYIIKNIGTPEEEKIPVTEIMKEKEINDREKAGNSHPLDDEKLIIKRRKAELKMETDRLNEEDEARYPRTSKCRRIQHDRRSGMGETYHQLVTKQNSLNLLLDETNRKTVVSSKFFRELIYLYPVQWYAAPKYAQNYPIQQRFGPKTIREHPREERSRILPFIQRQIEALPWRANSRYRLASCAEFIFSKITNEPIQSGNLETYLIRDMGIPNQVAGRFCEELHHFCASGLTEDEYYTISCYKCKDLPQNFGVGGLQNGNHVVVTLDDDMPTSDEIIAVDNDSDIEVVFNSNPTPPQRESNFIREEPFGSSSDENDVDLFTRRACRIPRLPPRHMSLRRRPEGPSTSRQEPRDLRGHIITEPPRPTEAPAFRPSPFIDYKRSFAPHCGRNPHDTTSSVISQPHIQNIWGQVVQPSTMVDPRQVAFHVHLPTQPQFRTPWDNYEDIMAAQNTGQQQWAPPAVIAVPPHVITVDTPSSSIQAVPDDNNVEDVLQVPQTSPVHVVSQETQETQGTSGVNETQSRDETAKSSKKEKKKTGIERAQKKVEEKEKKLITVHDHERHIKWLKVCVAKMEAKLEKVKENEKESRHRNNGESRDSRKYYHSRDRSRSRSPRRRTLSPDRRHSYSNRN